MLPSSWDAYWTALILSLVPSGLSTQETQNPNPIPPHLLAEAEFQLLASANHMLQPPQELRLQAWAIILSQNSTWKAYLKESV